MKFELIIPSRCTAVLPEDLNKPHLVGEPKMDGSRYVLYMGGCPYERQRGANTLLSRRVSVTDNKHVDKTANVPHITEGEYPDLNGTVLDGEIQSADFLATNSIMNSGPALAIQKQNEVGLLNYFVFDILFFRGKDVRNLPLEKRRKVLSEVVKRMNNENVKLMPQFSANDRDLAAFFNELVSEGGEGIIVKDKRQAYGVGWAKMKKSYDVSCFITGFKPGKPGSKYEKTVGAIALSVLHDGKRVEVGFASGFDDKIRHDMHKNPNKYLNRVVDIFTQEIQNSQRSADNPIGRLRHPTFFRFRDDLETTDCTSEKLIDALKAGKTRSSRFKKKD
jgi:ATP-dependent DNA ligase